MYKQRSTSTTSCIYKNLVVSCWKLWEVYLLPPGSSKNSVVVCIGWKAYLFHRPSPTNEPCHTILVIGLPSISRLSDSFLGYSLMYNNKRYRYIVMPMLLVVLSLLLSDYYCYSRLLSCTCSMIDRDQHSFLYRLIRNVVRHRRCHLLSNHGWSTKKRKKNPKKIVHNHLIKKSLNFSYHFLSSIIISTIS